MVLWQGFFRKYAKTTQKTTKFTTWRRFIWATFALTKLFNCLRLLLYVQIQSPNAAKNKAPSDDGALFFATFGDGAKKFFAPLSMPRGSAPIIPCGSAFRICLRQIHGSRRRARARVRGGFLCKSSDDGALFFATFGDGANSLPHSLCLGTLPLLYPAAPPSVFAVGKYTATTPSPTSTSAMTTRTWTEPTGILSTS